MTLSKTDAQPLLMFRVSHALSIAGGKAESTSDGMNTFVHNWNSWLLASDSIPEDDIVQTATRKLLEAVKQMTNDEYLLTTQVDLRCPESMSDEHQCAVDELVHGLNDLTIISSIKEIVSQSDFSESVNQIGRLAMTKKACRAILDSHPESRSEPMEKVCSFTQLEASHFISALLLAWPYQQCHDSNGNCLLRLTTQELSKRSLALNNEISQLRQQLTIVFRFG